MSVIPFPALACPLDGDPLHREGAAWRCPAGHHFDVAAQGYTHLLLVQHKRSRDPGDSKEMVAARRRYLNAGHYQPIAEAVARATLADLPTGSTAACLDAGCGEGYYLRQLAAQAGHDRTLALLGLDISKWAILAAAKQDKGGAADQPPGPCTTWVVGSNAHLPVLPGQFDRILCLFGFPVYGEFARVLKPGGRIIQADAGPDHLRELREVIYPVLKPERPPKTEAPPGFAELPGDSIRYQAKIQGAEAIADLLAMTPHLYRATAEGRARAAALTAISVSVDVRLRVFQRLAD